MLIKYFSVENFYSIKKEHILEFDLGIKKGTPYSAHPVIGFAGANASGKTTILKAFTFVLWFMQNSFFNLEEDEKILFEPFCTLSNEPTKFHIIFAKNSLVDGKCKQVDYEYTLCVTEKKVISETLHYYPYGRERLVYNREGNKVKFGASVNRIQTKDLRRNSSIVSFAAQFDSQKIAQSCKNYEVAYNVLFSGFSEHEFHPAIIETMIENENTKQKLQLFLNIADIGIQDAHIIENPEATEELLQSFEKLSEDEKQKLPLPIIENLGKLKENSGVIRELFFIHKIDGDLIDFDPDSESSGTRKFLTLLHLILRVLEDGSLLILDEIELKLHQNLVAYLIGLFENKSENPKGAQLIFSFHNTAFMELLKPTQLWFTEKNDEGHTEVFCAADFKDIKQLHQRNLETLYRIGRFGAKPRGI